MDNPLMGFRLAYLRAIAKSWKDPAFQEKLLNADDILEVLKEPPYSFVSPWKYVKINLIDERNTAWKPKEAAGWIGPNDFFIINLPAKPEEDGQQVQALATYYQIFPDLFGQSPKEDHGINQQLPVGLGVDPGTFLEFGGVTLRAIALAWENDRFLTELTDPGLIDATPVLSKYLGYNNPWNFDIQFIMSDFGWDEAKCKWTNIPQNTIRLHYPCKPEEEKFWPIALASYNNTGPEYPFTCA